MLLRIPIGLLSIANAVLIFTSWAIEFHVFESTARYPSGVLLISGALMAYLPYHCVTRGETLFRNDPGGRKSRTVFYGIAYIFFVIFLLLDIDLIRAWAAGE